MSAITYKNQNTNTNTNTKQQLTTKQVAEQKIKDLRGTNNGTWGFGMFGAFFPENMNGPLGYQFNPLPNDNEAHVLLNGPQYNSKDGNFPAYNADHFRSLSGYDTGFSMSSEPDSIFTSKCKRV